VTVTAKAAPPRTLAGQLRHGARNLIKASSEFRRAVDLPTDTKGDMVARVKLDRQGWIRTQIGHGLVAAWALALVSACVVNADGPAAVVVAAAAAAAAVLMRWAAKAGPAAVAALWPVVVAAVTWAATAALGGLLVTMCVAVVAALCVVALLATLIVYAWDDGSVLDNLGLKPRSGAITADLVQRAVAVGCGIDVIRHPEQAALVQPTTPIVNEGAVGWVAQARLPHGKSVEIVRQNHTRVAGVLEVPAEVLDISEGDHPNLVVIRRRDRGSREIPAQRPPLADHPQVTSIWDGWRFGVGEQLQPALVCLMDGPLLIGGQRGAGKTVAELGILAHLVCDPDTDTYLADGKEVDTLAYRDVVARWVGADITDLLIMLREAEARMMANQAMLKSLPGFHPKLTRDLCARHSIRPIAVVIDELAFYTANQRWDRKPRAEVLDILCRLAEYGRAFGVTLVICTQTPTAAVLPERLAAQMAMRLALRTANAEVGNLILGGDSAKQGHRTDRMLGGPGAGILRDLERFTRVQCDKFNPLLDTERIVVFATALRETLRVQPGQVAEDRTMAQRDATARAEALAPPLLTLALTKAREVGKGVPSGALLAAVTAQPEVLPQGVQLPTDEQGLADLMRGFGVRPVKFRVGPDTPRGYTLAALLTAATGSSPGTPPGTGAGTPPGTGVEQGLAQVVPLRPRRDGVPAPVPASVPASVPARVPAATSNDHGAEEC